MDNETGSKRGRGRGRARGRGRGGRGRGRGRAKKMVIESDDDEMKEEQIETTETVDNMVEIPDEPEGASDIFLKSNTELGTLPKEHEFSIDDDIESLVPPTFSTLSTGPPQPMIELDWNHNYNPCAERVPSPNIHMCVSCLLPIRLYGRLIPCKHVYCYNCATKQIGTCSGCNEKVHRIEQAHLGSVHMCNHEGSRYGFDGCRRTYLSHRDLQAHINHRHKPRNVVSTSEGLIPPQHSLSLLDSVGFPSPRQSIPNAHSSRSNLMPVSMHNSGSSPRIKPDSQSLLIPSPENSSTPTSTGSRYDRERERERDRERKSSSSSSYSSSLYSRPNRQFRQF